MKVRAALAKLRTLPAALKRDWPEIKRDLKPPLIRGKRRVVNYGLAGLAGYAGARHAEKGKRR